MTSHPAWGTHRLLILGAIAEAATLARAAAEGWGARLEVVSALTAGPERGGPLPGRVRIGGFAGAGDLERYLRAESIDLLIDATDPFEPGISADARVAAEAAAVPRLVYVRPSWRRDPRDRWVEVSDLAGAAVVLPRVGRRVMLAVGDGGLEPFARALGFFFLVRVRTAPRAALPLEGALVEVGAGPASVATERQLISRHRIDAVVTRATGGNFHEPTVLAARAAELPIVMVRRPLPPPGERAESVEAVLLWLSRRISLRERRLSRALEAD